MAIRLETMFPVELEQHLRSSPVLVLPFGTIEWHSHHLPLGLDGIVAEAMGTRMAEAMNAVLAPVCYWAVGGVPFPYTLNLPLAEVESLLRTVLVQHSRMGFQFILLFTGHFGLDQTLAVKRSALRAMEETSSTILAFTTYDLVADFCAGDHAGIAESSLMMSLRPDLVRFGAWPQKDVLPGVIGEDPRGVASAEFGKRILHVSTTRAAALVSDFRIAATHRGAWVTALSVAVACLEQTRLLRGTPTREKVPGITTGDYLEGCASLARGDFATAKVAFEAKLQSLQSIS